MPEPSASPPAVPVLDSSPAAAGQPRIPWWASIESRILAGLLTILVLISGVAGIVLLAGGRDHLTEASYQLHEAAGDLIASRLATRLAAAEATVLALAAVGAESSEPYDSETLRKMIPRLLDSRGADGIVAGGGVWPKAGAFDPGVERASLFWGRDRTGRFVPHEGYNDPDGPGYHREEWYVPAMYLAPGHVYWSRTYTDPFTSEPMVTCSSPMYRESRFLGVATVDLKLEAFAPLFESIGDGPGSYGFILDRNDAFVWFPRNELVHRRGPGENGTSTTTFLTAEDFAREQPDFEPVANAVRAFTARLTADARSGDENLAALARELVTGSDSIRRAESLRIAALLQGAGSSDEARTSSRKRIPVPNDVLLGEPGVASIFFLPGPHWKVVTIAPEKLVTAGAEAFLLRFGLVAGLLVALAVAVAWWMLRRGVIVPLRKMTAALRRVSENRDVSAELEPLGADNELDLLAYWFNHRTRLLDQARTAAENANRSKSEFLANMSHEIRTPMTAILGYTDVLLDPQEAPEAKREATGIIKRNGDHLLCVINDLLDLSRLESGKLDVERERTPIRQIAEEVVSLLDVRALEKRIALTLEIDDAVPAFVQSDSLRVRQVLLNLVGNAVKFTDRGGVKVVVRWAAAPNGTRCIAFEVIDTGIGITPEGIDRLFDPFSQADSSMTRRYGGSGLGLTISLRLARLLGGGIQVHSRAGMGSRFTFTLDPGSAAELEAIAESAGPPMPASGARPSSVGLRAPFASGSRVLLVEDVEVNRQLLRRILEKAGLEVETAEHGQQALDRYASASRRRGTFAAIVMDVQMPVMDGHTAAARLRAEGYDGFLLACTAHALQGDREKCLDSGFDDVVTKPIDRKILLAKLAAALNRDPDVVGSPG